jgi:hypothetical protein
MEQLSARLGRMLAECDADCSASKPASAFELPLELLWHINKFLSLQSASRLATTCSSFCSAFRSLPQECFRREVYRRCGLIFTGAEDDDGIDWKAACSNLHVLWNRFHDLPRICDQGQKYLRWINGRAADSPEVRHMIVGLSLLPTRIEAIFCGPEHGPLEGALKPDYRRALHFLFGRRGDGHNARAGAGRCFDVRRLLALLRWVLGDDQDAGAPGQRRSDGDAPVGPRNVMKRLRLLLAECGQIVARNPYSFIEDRLFVSRGHPRRSRLQNAGEL